MATPKHPFCDCPTDASFARMEQLERRLKRAAWFGAPYPYLLGKTGERLETMRIRRHACRWHEPALRRIFQDAGRF